MKRLTARDIMNADVITVREDMPIRDLANLLTDKMITGAPVVNKKGQLVGVVSASDIVRNEAHRAAIVQDNVSSYYLHGWEDQLSIDEIDMFHVEAGEDLTVRDIMTPIIFKVSEDTPISEMADAMIGGRIHRLIVTRDDKVVGIVTTLDMLKAIREYAQ